MIFKHPDSRFESLLNDEQSVRLTSDRVELHEKGSIEIGGQKLTPDFATAYVDFRVSYALSKAGRPITAYNSAFHAGTVANSFRTMRHKVFNFRHQMVQNGRDVDAELATREDRILGTILEVEFPRTPPGGWQLTEFDQTPYIRGVAALHKRAKGAGKIIQEYLSGKDWAVSMEVRYQLIDSGVVLLRTPEAKDLPEDWQKELKERTPADFLGAGLWYLPLIEAPDELLDCWDRKEGMFNRRWKGYQPVTLAGGLNGEIQYFGLALVEHGAEPTAHVAEMLAEDPGLRQISEGLQRLQSAIERVSFES